MFNVGDRVRLIQDIDVFGNIPAKVGDEFEVERIYNPQGSYRGYKLLDFDFAVFEDEMELVAPLSLENE